MNTEPSTKDVMLHLISIKRHCGAPRRLSRDLSNCKGLMARGFLGDHFKNQSRYSLNAYVLTPRLVKSVGSTGSTLGIA